MGLTLSSNTDCIVVRKSGVSFSGISSGIISVTLTFPELKREVFHANYSTAHPEKLQNFGIPEKFRFLHRCAGRLQVAGLITGCFQGIKLSFCWRVKNKHVKNCLPMPGGTLFNKLRLQTHPSFLFTLLIQLLVSLSYQCKTPPSISIRICLKLSVHKKRKWEV